jgi:glycerol-3-phosphate dehydrogenase
VARVAPGLVAIAGGKYTTYRVMAADAVDAAAVDIPHRVAPSITDKVPLLGADGYHALVNQAEQIAARYRLHPHRVTHLLNRYGSLLHHVLELADERRELLSPVPGSPAYLQVEVVHAASHEGALHLDDVLARRTRISIEYPHRGVESAQPVAELMAEVLGWDADTLRREVEIYTARVASERESQNQPDDAAADAVRVAAPDARPGLSSHANTAPTR